MWINWVQWIMEGLPSSRCWLSLGCRRGREWPLNPSMLNYRTRRNATHLVHHLTLAWEVRNWLLKRVQVHSGQVQGKDWELKGGRSGRGLMCFRRGNLLLGIQSKILTKNHWSAKTMGVLVVYPRTNNPIMQIWLNSRMLTHSINWSNSKHHLKYRKRQLTNVKLNRKPPSTHLSNRMKYSSMMRARLRDLSCKIFIVSASNKSNPLPGIYQSKNSTVPLIWMISWLNSVQEPPLSPMRKSFGFSIYPRMKTHQQRLKSIWQVIRRNILLRAKRSPD